MPYKVEFHPKVEKDFDCVPVGDVKRILAAIRDKLTDTPKTGTALRGELRGFYKLRVGEYRVVYAVKGDVVFVLVVAQRGKVYKLAKRRM